MLTREAFEEITECQKKKFEIYNNAFADIVVYAASKNDRVLGDMVSKALDEVLDLNNKFIKEHEKYEN